ncbi:conserved hypothetical protein [Theileria equi strain WA]|uniref:Uncharacterized protein n=1 Tax=Theileria equi strain WA TaxID=1537102 RepID=L1LB10_THEEQ|nr:conserved hypothetical protein [Theileria equi strain WA]EKX72637.1 conserved hypothetical protein [Theileria equi strain WA]|eukprot:XP_004832089.1 conserved hypothetical protein [Theileria equi strain WA]
MNVTLVHLLYTLAAESRKNNEDSTDKHESKTGIRELFERIREGMKLCSNDSEISEEESETQGIYTVKVICKLEKLAKDALERVFNKDYGRSHHELVVNGMVLMIAFLSPEQFSWHYHIDPMENSLKFCCRFAKVTAESLELHLSSLSALFSSICAICDENGFCEDIDEHQTRQPSKVLRSLGTMLQLIYLPAKTNFSEPNLIITKLAVEHDVVEFFCNEESAKYPDIKLYNKLASGYNLYNIPCRLSVFGCRIILRSYESIFAIPEFHDHRVALPYLVLISNTTNGIHMGEFYSALILVLDNMHGTLFECKNVQLDKHPIDGILREMVKRVYSDILRFNEHLDKCLECFIKLTSLAYKEDDVRLYDTMEELMDKLLFMDNIECTIVYLKHYHLYLERAPLACASTMIQTMELIFTLTNSIHTVNGLECIEKLLEHIPDDTIYYLYDIHCRLTILYLQLVCEGNGLKDSIANLQENKVFNGTIVKMKDDFEHLGKTLHRKEVIGAMERIWKLILGIIGEDKLTQFMAGARDKIAQSTHAHTIKCVFDYYDLVTTF